MSDVQEFVQELTEKTCAICALGEGFAADLDYVLAQIDAGKNIPTAAFIAWAQKKYSSASITKDRLRRHYQVCMGRPSWR